MSWERDTIFAKAKLYFDRAFDESRDDPLFGLWCSFGLELLARAAVASVSPTLLAEPDDQQRNLLHALGKGSTKSTPKSIPTSQVLNLCRTLFKDFTEQDKSAALALANRRNDELHTGVAAFEEYQPKHWLVGFYRCCDILAKAMNESLESLFGDDEAVVAKNILEEAKLEAKQRVENAIAAYRKVFDEKPAEERSALAAKVEEEVKLLSHLRHHDVKCPACQCSATVQGDAFGRTHVTTDGDTVTVKQPVSPASFECKACGLKLNGYAELDVAQLGGHYTRTVEYSPEEFYGITSAENLDLEELADLIESNYPMHRVISTGEEYDND